jgi:hypothetical protein
MLCIMYAHMWQIEGTHDVGILTHTEYSNSGPLPLPIGDCFDLLALSESRQYCAKHAG